jgi:hypothetical protein
VARPKIFGLEKPFCEIFQIPNSSFAFSFFYWFLSTWLHQGKAVKMSLKSCFHHLPRRFGHVSRYRQGQAVVVGLAKPQSVAYAALLLYRWLAVAPSDELRGTYRNRSGAGLVVLGRLHFANVTMT